MNEEYTPDEGEAEIEIDDDELEIDDEALEAAAGGADPPERENSPARGYDRNTWGA